MVGYISDNPTPQAPEEAANLGYLQDTPPPDGVLDSIAHIESTSGMISRGLERAAVTHPEMQSDPFMTEIPYHEPGDNTETKPLDLPKIGADEINKNYAPIGVDGKQVKITNTPVPDEVGQMLGKAKKEELDAQDTWRRFSQTHSAPVNFGVGMAGFMMDPLNAATVFIPGVGEETALAGLGRAGLTQGIVARTGARLIAGATAGAAAQAPLSAIKYDLAPQEMNDYSLRDAFKDMAFAAAGNAVVHAGVFGAARETGILKPDEIMKVKPNEPPSSSTPPPSAAPTEVPAAPEAPYNIYTPEGHQINPSDKLSSVNPDAMPETSVRTYNIQDAMNIMNADAPTKHAALTSAVSQVIDGKSVDVTDIIQPAETAGKTDYNKVDPTQLKESVAELMEDDRKKNQLPISTLQVFAGEPKLPRELAGAKPRYKGETPQFASDIDKALYIVGNEVKKSNKDSAYRDFLTKHGYDDASIASAAKQVREHVKETAKTSQPGELKIEKQNGAKSQEPSAVPPEPVSSVTKHGIDKETLRAALKESGVNAADSAEVAAKKLAQKSKEIFTPKTKTIDLGRIAEKQQQLARDGYAPNMTSDELEEATNDLFNEKEENYEKLEREAIHEHEGGMTPEEAKAAADRADTHESDLANTPPEKAEAVADTVNHEYISNAKKQLPEEYHEIIAGTEIEGREADTPEPTKSGGETGSGARETSGSPESAKERPSGSGSKGKSGGKPAGDTGGTTGKPNIIDDEIAKMQSQLDTTKLTQDERGLLAQAAKEVETAEAYRKGFEAAGNCLAEEGE